MTVDTAEPAKILCLGEVMLRLDPGAGRIRTARNFDVWEGGGEYNVGKALASVFGHPVSLVSALVDNEVGQLISSMIRSSGVETSAMTWVPSDGLGYSSRNGLNFTERGFGRRAPLGVSDRGHSAASQFLLTENEWDDIFVSYAPRVFHTGGIYAALSENSYRNLSRALGAARRRGVTVSYDFNHRPSLWEAHGSREHVRELNLSLMENVDILFGGEFDIATSLGLDVPSANEDDLLSVESFETAAESLAQRYPRLEALVSTRRYTHSSTSHDLAAVAWSRSGGMWSSQIQSGLEVYDRVGAGDAFAAGFIHGHSSQWPLDECLNWGVASGALAMTTPGDSFIASSDEVLMLVQGNTAKIKR